MAEEKRLTWKQSIDGYTDVGLREGVTVGDAICKLADLEARETVEVVHGQWKRTPISGTVFCSACDKIPEFQIETNYCPNCGAKMDGGNKDG